MAGRDIVGDVHGHGDALRALLGALGYAERGGAFRHPGGRVAVFVGDLVDRGPRQVEAVDLVRRMLDAGTAVAVAGNHEFNAACFAHEDPRSPGDHVRRRRGRNVGHHQSYLDQVGGADSALHREHAAFFASLPLWLDLGDLRVVHACWHPASIALLSGILEPGRGFGARFAELATDPAAFDAAEKLCKGVEVALPPGVTFLDAQGSTRRRGRAAWWVEDAASLADVVAEPALRGRVPDAPAPEGSFLPDDGGSPILFGHYWMTGLPRLLTRTRACLDFSVAKGGVLCAYRHDGERELDVAKLAWVPADVGAAG